MSQIDYQDWIAERQHLLERIHELEAENVELRRRLSVEVGHITEASATMKRLSLQDKINLFRSLFKGREDVFARRWYSKTTGKSGYQPVCQNEWNPQLCDKKKYKCSDCPNRQFAHITDNDFYRHLEGKDTDAEM